jgi:hypothetical protein
MVARSRWVKFVVSDAEHEVLTAAAQRWGLARGAFIARAALAAARQEAQARSPEAAEIIAAIEVLGRKLDSNGVNLNQAVAKLHSTGRYDRDLVRYAERVAGLERDLDDLADEVRKRLP